MKTILLLLLSATFIACAASNDEQVDSAMREARYYLTKSKCSKAKKALDDVSYQSRNAAYVGLYSNYYGCLAGYSELNDAIPNLQNIDVSTASAVFQSFASFTTSDETQADDADYLNLFSAINVITESTATSGGSERESRFGVRGGTDLSMQLLYMSLVTFGKFLAYYGNADSSGLKGQGAAANTCIARYDEHANAGLGNWFPQTDGCASGDDAHSDLNGAVAEATKLTRLCQGIIAFNNILDVLINTTLSSSDTLGDLTDVETILSALFAAAKANEISELGTNTVIDTMKNILTVDDCEAEGYDSALTYMGFVIEANYSDS